jgi:hypothetical protein
LISLRLAVSTNNSPFLKRQAVIALGVIARA